MSDSLQLAPADAGQDARRADLSVIRADIEQRVAALKQTAETLTVTDATQLTEMKLARKTRLALKEIRLHVESRHKELKADVLKRGQELDAFKRKCIAIIEPLEARLLEQEQFTERAEKARQDALARERQKVLAEYDVLDAGLDLGTMPQAAWDAMLVGAKATWAEKAAALYQAEQDRKAAAKAAEEERARIKAENERLKAEADKARAERDAAQAKAAVEAEAQRQERLKEQAAREVERQKAEAAAHAEREKQDREKAEIQAKADAAAKVEREAREKIEAELAAKKKAEADAEKARLDAERKAASAPDKAKLRALSDTILRTVDAVEMRTDDGKKSLAEIRASAVQLIALISRRAEAL